MNLGFAHPLTFYNKGKKEKILQKLKLLSWCLLCVTWWAGIYKLVTCSLMRFTFYCSNRCQNKTLCMEKLSLVLPETPLYSPRQFGRCAVIGNSGDLLKTRFGKEIDGYDVVIRENGAPIQVNMFLYSTSNFAAFASLRIYLLVTFFLLFYCRTILTMWARKVHFVFLTGDLPKLLIKL